MADIKNEILWRIYVVLLLVIIFAVVVFAKAIKIQTVEGEKWRKKAEELYLAYQPVEALRGNVFSADGSLLATSLPFFELRLDLLAVAEPDFKNNIDTLSILFSKFIDSTRTPGAHKARLIDARANNERFLLLKKQVTYPEMQLIKDFPMFNLGRNKGGLIIIKRSRRYNPFKMLAHRTIGYVRDSIKPIGIEGYFDDILAGQKGQQLMQRIAGGIWVPVGDLAALDPKNGKDIVTTIDVNLQDVTENALLQALQHHDADNGSAILMEVKTGKIVAIANIGKTENNEYWENYNYAIGAATEPGSTFKAVTMAALLEDNLINPLDSIDLHQGRIDFFGESMEDASAHGLERTTIQHAFEISSNVGIAELAYRHYQQPHREDKFIQRLKQFHLDQPTNIEVEGEGEPYIKNVGDNSWSGITLPWMSTGYELKITPLQLLNFYNTIANNGVMMKPYLVSEIQDMGEPTKNFQPKVIDRGMITPATVKKLKELLAGVVQNGTAKAIQSKNYNIAGKTGTAITNFKKDLGKGYRKYQASFAGFFPAENPAYSCIVTVTNPRVNGLYGGQVAAPIFKEIADKCYATRYAMHEPLNKGKTPKLTPEQLPIVMGGYTRETKQILDYLDFSYTDPTKTEWSSIRSDTLGNIYFIPNMWDDNVVPDVRGMGIRDALFLLENRGLRTTFSGTGRVISQSIRPGTKAIGQYIKIYLK
jgi:cell division protein FtsI (penicillin-binding protein 3)